MRYTPIAANSDASVLVRFNILLVIVIGLLIFFGAAAISNMLTLPIQQLLNHMKNIENGQLEKIREQTFLSEFKALFRGYNELVDEIRHLIQETIERQKRLSLIHISEPTRPEP